MNILVNLLFFLSTSMLLIDCVLISPKPYENDFSNIVRLSVKDSTSKILDVLTVVDCQNIYKTIKNPSKNRNNPTIVDNINVYNVISNEKNIQGYYNAKLEVNSNDFIRFSGVSESNNFDYSVIIYKVESPLLSKTFPETAKKLAAEPSDNNVFPVTFSEKTFHYTTNLALKRGKETYVSYFAIYHRPDGNDQELLGYFKYTSEINVK